MTCIHGFQLELLFYLFPYCQDLEEKWKTKTFILSLPTIRIRVKVVIVNDNDLSLTWLNAGKYCYLCTEMC